MKKLFFIVLTLSVMPFCANAQCQCMQDKITISDIDIVRNGNDVLVTFQAQTGKDMIKGNASYIFYPVITNGEHKAALPAVIVRGKHAASVEARNQRLSGQSVVQPEFSVVQPGMPVNYSATVPFQEWMEDAALVMESSSWGCNTSETYSDKLLADRIFPPAQPITVADSKPRLSTGDSLALNFSFVIPESQWNKTNPFYDKDREQALIIYYPINKSNIQLDYKDNRNTLTNLSAIINTIFESSDSRVTRVVVAGFSSPDGSFAHNDRLAWDRAMSVKEYIVKNTRIKSKEVFVYNGSEDWQGLRAMVEASTFYDKAEILQIIDTVPLFSEDGRRKERIRKIKELNHGITYRYMLRYFFPLLRNSAFIKVYYSNK